MNRPNIIVLALLTLIAMADLAFPDTFGYDAAGRLTSVSQSNGISYTIVPDAQSNLASITYSSSSSGATGIPDWWENYYFGNTGIDPMASNTSDGISNLMKYELGQSPLISDTNTLVFGNRRNYSDGNTYMYFTYFCSTDPSSSVFMEQSADGTTWLYGNTYFQEVTVQDLGNGTEEVTTRCLTPLPQAANLYFRLEAAGTSVSAYDSVYTPEPIPQWWTAQSVVNSKKPSDFALVNQGQLKQIATAAIAQFNSTLNGGAGASLNALGTRLNTVTAHTKDYATVNVGQLKEIARPFYDRLAQAGYTGPPLVAGQVYPWDGQPIPAKDYGAANIGQTKNIFSFIFQPLFLSGTGN